MKKNGRKCVGEKSLPQHVHRRNGERRKKPAVRRSKLQELLDCPTDFTCPICMKEVPKADIASIVPCQHSYCVYCIVRWAEEKDSAVCPVCKGRFHSVWTLKTLDGNVLTEPARESVCLIKRASWYRDKGGRELVSGNEGGGEDEEWDEGDFYTNDIDDTEDYYFSKAAGSARIVLTNRTFGKNGYMRSGRVYAQSCPTQKHKTVEDGEDTHEAEDGLLEAKKETKKTNTKGKKALRRERKKNEEANRIF